MTYEDLKNRFEYHPPRDTEVEDCHAAVRKAAFNLALTIYALAPDSREKEKAIDKIEEFMFWANAAIARNQG